MNSTPSSTKRRKPLSQKQTNTDKKEPPYYPLSVGRIFKKVFAYKEHSEHLLQAILDDPNLQLHSANPEIARYSASDRKVRYEFHCVLGSGEKVLVEIQNQYQRERTVPRIIAGLSIEIASQMIHGGTTEAKRTEYSILPVYSIWIVNFRMTKKGETRLITRINYKTEGAELNDQADVDFADEFRRYTNIILVHLPNLPSEFPDAEKGFGENELLKNWLSLFKRPLLANLELPSIFKNSIFRPVVKLIQSSTFEKRDKDDIERDLEVLDVLLSENEEISKLAGMVADLGNVNTTLQGVLDETTKRAESLEAEKEKERAARELAEHKNKTLRTLGRERVDMYADVNGTSIDAEIDSASSKEEVDEILKRELSKLRQFQKYQVN